MTRINYTLVINWYDLDPMTSDDCWRKMRTYNYVRCPACDVVRPFGPTDTAVLLSRAVPTCNEYWLSDRVPKNLQRYGELLNSLQHKGWNWVRLVIELGQLEVLCDLHKASRGEQIPLDFREGPPTLVGGRC